MLDALVDAVVDDYFDQYVCGLAGFGLLSLIEDFLICGCDPATEDFLGISVVSEE